MKLTTLLLCALLCVPSFGQTNTARMLSGINAQTGTSYVFQPSDATKLTTFANAGSMSATLPNPSTLGFGSGTIFSMQNQGPGTLTIVCACTITTASAASTSLVLGAGTSADLYSSGTGYAANSSAGNVGSSIGAAVPIYTGPGTTLTPDPFFGDLTGLGDLFAKSFTLTGVGAVFTLPCQTAPPNPAAGNILFYCDSGTGLLTSLNPSGGSANPGGAAFSALTSGANSNSGTFSASGNTWDFTGVTQFRLRTGAGLTTSATGGIGYDTTNNNWHVFGNAVDNFVGLLIASGTYTAGHCISINTINPLTLTDAGAGCGGSSAGAPIFFGANGGNFPTSGTFFVGGGTAPGTTEASHQTSVPRAGTVSGLSCRVANALSSTQTYTYTVFKGLAGNGAVTGSATTSTCVMNSTNTNGCQDNTHTFTVAQDDILEIQVVAANTPTASQGNCTVLLQ